MAHVHPLQLVTSKRRKEKGGKTGERERKEAAVVLSLALAKLPVKTGHEVWLWAKAQSLEGPRPATWISADFGGGGGGGGGR